jgi:predicted GIY-YIG superfamily endonuclease
MYFVYVLRSLSASKSYVGFTNNLVRRLGEHNEGKHFYTKRHAPWQIVYSEQYDTLKDARGREKYLKSAAGRRFLKTEVFRNH